MEIGMKIYYEKATGNVILNTGERIGSVVATTWEQDFASFKALNERMPETVGVVELEYRQYAQEFEESVGYRINPETEKVEFAYPDSTTQPGEPTEPVYRQSLTDRVAALGAELINTQLALTSNYEELQAAKKEAAEAQLALTELYELVLAEKTGQPELPAEGGEVDNG